MATNKNQKKNSLETISNNDPKLGKFLKFFLENNFTINDDYKKKSEFLSLVRIIIGQQLSISSAGSIYSRFIKKYGEEIEFIDNLENSKEDLLSLGLSNNKANTIIEINKLVNTKKIDLSKISTYEEKEAKDILCKIKGIGPWTVENFLIFSGNNTDICPANDLGLKKGIKIIYKLKDLPSDEEVYKIAEKWRPYRSIASRYIWEVVDQKISLT